LDAVDELRTIATAAGLSVAQLCVGVLLATPGLTGCIVGARNARQGALITGLGVAVSPEQTAAVKDVVVRLQSDL
jgi:aryl-alcohol dehydrogenase-like predicted oxidoreductase